MAFLDYNARLNHMLKGSISYDAEVLVSDYRVIRAEDLQASGLDLEKGEEKEKKELLIMHSKFKYSAILGSATSIEFLILLRECKLSSIWETNIRYLIEEKWRRTRWFTILISVLHLGYIVLASIYATAAMDSPGYRAFIFTLTLLWYLQELFEIFAEHEQYFQSIWSYLDFFGTQFFMLHCALVWGNVLDT